MPKPDPGCRQAIIFWLTKGRAGLRHGIVKTRLALEAVLLFHSGSPWDDAKKLKWRVITDEMLGEAHDPKHGHDATTKVLCDVVRASLAGSQEIR